MTLDLFRCNHIVYSLQDAMRSFDTVERQVGVGLAIGYVFPHLHITCC